MHVPITTEQDPDIIYALFRPATEQESSEARGGICWRVITAPWFLVCKVMGTAEIIFKRDNLLNWKRPILQDLVARVGVCLGYYPEDQFIKSIYSMMGDRHLIEGNEEVVKALLSHHRNEDIFENSMSFKKLFELVKMAFPEECFTEEDFMFTCSPQQTKIYRTLLHKMMNGSKIQEFTPSIRQNVQETLEEWRSHCEAGYPINLNLACRQFTSAILTELLFDDKETSQHISKAIDFINYYTVQSIMSFHVKEEDKEQLKSILKVLSCAVDTILEKIDIPLFRSNPDLSQARKKALIFILFFAGQDTTASLLTYILHKLARNPDLQNNLLSEIKMSQQQETLKITCIKNLFNQSIGEFTPAYGIGRALKTDVCFEYQFENESEKKQRVFFKGEILSTLLYKLAEKNLCSEEDRLNYQKWFPFGSGRHQCPGEKLARQEIMVFIQELLSNYSIETEQVEEIERRGLITLQFAEEIEITLKPLEKSKED